MAVDGPAVTLATTAAGQNGSLTFSAIQGQRIQFQSSGSTYALKPSVKLVRPNGAVLWSSLGNGTMAATVLPESGTYVVTLDPADTTTGAMTFRVWTSP
jgi:hypothetical protein